MQQLLLIIHVLVSVSLIALVLMQHGKGADIGAAFGSGASQTIFGSQGPASFLLKLTAGLAAVFFATSLSLSYLAMHGASSPSATMMLPPVSKTVPGNVPDTKSSSLPVSPSA